MANTKISALSAVTAPSSTDVLPIVSSSVTKKVTVADLVAAAPSVVDLEAAVDLKAPLDSPALTGTPTAPTAAAATNTTQVATTAFVRAEITPLVVGPATATDNAIARYDLTTGKLLQNSSVLISDAGNMSGVGTIDCGAVNSTSTVQSASTNGFRIGSRGLMSASADGVWQMANNAGTQPAGLKIGRVVSAKTTDYTVLAASDSNTFFTNTGAGAGVIFTLPTPVAGQTFEFYRDANQTVTIDVGTGVTIRAGASVSTDGGNVTLDAVGSKLRIVAISATQWVGDVTGGVTFN